MLQGFLTVLSWLFTVSMGLFRVVYWDFMRFYKSLHGFDFIGFRRI